MKLKTMDRISLKNNPQINEDMIQKFIFENPTVLGLGELTPSKRKNSTNWWTAGYFIS